MHAASRTYVFYGRTRSRKYAPHSHQSPFFPRLCYPSDPNCPPFGMPLHTNKRVLQRPRIPALPRMPLQRQCGQKRSSSPHLCCHCVETHQNYLIKCFVALASSRTYTLASHTTDTYAHRETYRHRNWRCAGGKSKYTTNDNAKLKYVLREKGFKWECGSR